MNLAVVPSVLGSGAGALIRMRATGSSTSRRGRGRRQGAALILTLLVVAILVVLVVQLTFSVKVEETIVRNMEDDTAMELAAVRGGIPLLAALFRDDRKNGNPAGDLDTLADIWCDPRTPDQRRFTLGDVEVTLEVEDLDRRLPLPWLADPQRKDMAEVALRRLIERLQPVDGDAAALAKQVADKVREIEGVTFAEGADGAPPAPQPGEGAPQARRFVSLDQLLAAPATEGGGAGSGGEAPAGIDRRLLYGDPEADPPRSGIAPFVTCWPVPQVNLNTVLPEVLFAILPEKNKGDEPLWDEADAIVEAVRRKRIDPTFQDGQGAGESGGQPAPEGGGQGASQQWSGAPFTKVEELESAELHAKLAQIFTKKEQGTEGTGGAGGTGGPGGPGGGGAGGTGDGQGQGEQEQFGFKNLLGVKSRYYMVRARARRGDGEGSVESVYRIMVHRGASDEVTPLLVAEVGSR